MRQQKGLVAFSPLCQGLLTDKYLQGIPDDSRMLRDGRYLNQRSLTDEKLAAIRELAKMAEERGQKLAEMALAWDLRDEAVTSVLIGASKPQQILANVRVLASAGFTAEELQRIDEISMAPGVQGLVH